MGSTGRGGGQGLRTEQRVDAVHDGDVQLRLARCQLQGDLGDHWRGQVTGGLKRTRGTRVRLLVRGWGWGERYLVMLLHGFQMQLDGWGAEGLHTAEHRGRCSSVFAGVIFRERQQLQHKKMETERWKKRMGRKMRGSKTKEQHLINR